ncbi:hypothetical protein Goklo_006502, partial [Gossypium klotzschianum]|nr:hypothetical protein [Gossypium klotzschianum]
MIILAYMWERILAATLWVNLALLLKNVLKKRCEK